MLWVRSYWWMDQAGGRASSTSSVIVISCLGQIRFWFQSSNPSDSLTWHIGTSYAAEVFYRTWVNPSKILFVPPDPIPTNVFPGFFFGRRAVLIPHWFPLLLVAILAAAPWMSWPKRFTLRTLLIATTLVAVVLGVIVWLKHY